MFSFRFFSLPCSLMLLASFLIILGPAGFSQERTATKQQSISLAELRYVLDLGGTGQHWPGLLEAGEVSTAENIDQSPAIV